MANGPAGRRGRRPLQLPVGGPGGARPPPAPGHPRPPGPPPPHAPPPEPANDRPWEQAPDWTPKEKFWAVMGVLKATLAIAGVYLVGLGVLLAVLFLLWK